jgi:hypothetical protein
MSTLWTPSGEHPVERNQPDDTSEPPPSQPTQAAAPDEEPLSPEEQAAAEEYAQQIDAMRRQLLDLPAGVVVGQHALQFFDVAGLYLSQTPPRIEDARLAIDALAAVVESLGSRLGDAEVPIRQALHQAQLAFVEAARTAGAAAEDD